MRIGLHFEGVTVDDLIPVFDIFDACYTQSPDGLVVAAHLPEGVTVDHVRRRLRAAEDLPEPRWSVEPDD